MIIPWYKDLNRFCDISFNIRKCRIIFDVVKIKDSTMIANHSDFTRHLGYWNSNNVMFWVMKEIFGAIVRRKNASHL